MMKKCSFDFDDTLSRVDVQRFAKRLIKEGYQLWIVTSRMSNKRAGNKSWNDDLFMVAESLGITNYHFCNLQPKRLFFEEHDFSFHLDDDIDDVQDINNHTNTTAVHFVPTIKMESFESCRSLL